MPTPGDRQGRPSPMMRSFALETEVQRLLREERYDLAVLVSQTLLELRVEAELVDFFEELNERDVGEAALGLLPSYNLGNGRVLAFFERLVGVRLRDDHGEAIAALRAHVERRNRIAHRGEQVDPRGRAGVAGRSARRLPARP